METSEVGLTTVIGRGHSGTRMLSQMFYASGVFMGNHISHRGDSLPPQAMYDACELVADHVRWTGDLSWDFSSLHAMPIDKRFEELVRTYLQSVLASTSSVRGWKLPETTLAYPWIVRMFPQAKYVHIMRDPRDGLLRPHRTDDLSESNVPGPVIEDELDRRVASWKYQYDIVKATPRPACFLSIRYEDLVLDVELTTQRLEEFLEIPLARIVVDRTRVGQWRSDRRLLPHIQPIAAEMGELGYG